jgi:hypothetical protein
MVLEMIWLIRECKSGISRSISAYALLVDYRRSGGRGYGYGYGHGHFTIYLFIFSIRYASSVDAYSVEKIDPKIS